MRSRLSVESPGGLQHLFEAVEGFVLGQSHEIIGHHSEAVHAFSRHRSFIFILVCNLIGLIPGFESPTGGSDRSAGLRYLCISLLPHAGIQACRSRSYLLHFLAADGRHAAIARILLAPLMLPIELVSHFARLLSLTVRLWANIFAGDLVTLVFFSMIPIGVPIIFMRIAHRGGDVQAYIFMLLTIIYASGRSRKSTRAGHWPVSWISFDARFASADFTDH